MKLLLLIVPILCFEKVHSFSFNQKKYERLGVNSEYSVGWVEQRLDHFDSYDTRTWIQRYFVNKTHFDVLENVAFLFLGGESPLDNSKINSSAWMDYAKHFKAICFNLEHRYYGESHPTENLSFENLRYLTSRQALADAEYFIKFINDKYSFSPDMKWIVFGESYSGSLAAWMRLFYPTVVHGAVSVSAAVLAKINFKEFYKNIYDVLRSRSKRCLRAIKRGIVQIEQLMLDLSGQQSLTELLRLCQPLEKNVNNPNDISLLFYHLANVFNSFVIRYGNDHRDPINVDNICQIMANQALGSELMRLAKVSGLLLDLNGQPCLSYSFNQGIIFHRNIEWNELTSTGERQWLYQLCTELGLFQTSDYKPQIFGNKFPLAYYITMCQQVFDPDFDYTFLEDSVHRIKLIYKRLKILVSNVVFVHGGYDPWKTLGITKSTRNRITAIVIKGSSHCASSSAPTPSDSKNLVHARNKIQQLIRKWLSN